MMRHVYTYSLLVAMTALFHVQFTLQWKHCDLLYKISVQSMKMFKNDVSKLQEIKGS